MRPKQRVIFLYNSIIGDVEQKGIRQGSLKCSRWHTGMYTEYLMRACRSYQSVLIWHVLSYPRITQLTCAPSHPSENDHYPAPPLFLWEAVHTPLQEDKILAVTNLMSLKLQRKRWKRSLKFIIFILLLLSNRIWKSWKSLSASKNIPWKSCLQAGIQIGYQSPGHWPTFVEG